MSYIAYGGHYYTWNGKMGYASSSTGSLTLLNGLLLHFKFNETSAYTTIANSTGGQGAQIFTNASLGYPGIIDNCLTINTSKGYCVLPNSIIDSSNFRDSKLSVSMWVKLNSSLGQYDQHIMQWQNKYSGGARVGLYYATNLDFYFYAYPKAADITYNEQVRTLAIFTGNWQHVACTVGGVGGEYKIYVNGINSTVTPYTMVNPIDQSIGGDYGGNNNLSLGNEFPGDDLGFSGGKIDEYAVWNRELSATEVSTLYNNGIGKTYPF